MSDFYVYEHWRPDKDECFYVGKGRGYRANILKRENNIHYMRILNKLKSNGHKVDIRIIYSGLTENDAFSIERERISFWRTNGVSLSNQTDGGEGMSGFTPSDQARANMSKGQTGRKHSEDTKSKMSIIRKGRQFSEETRRKLSESTRGISKGPMSTEARMKMSQSNKLRRELERNIIKESNLAVSAENLYLSGMTMKEVSNELGSYTNKIHKLLKLRNVPIRPAARRSIIPGPMTGKKLSSDTRAKIGLAHKGKTVSEETKLKMSSSKLLWWENKKQENSCHAQ